MSSGPGKLFHAIVGLGLAAAGCGGETATASREVDASRDVDAAKDASSRVVDAHAVVDAVADARTDSHDAGTLDASRPVDAATAHDAALDAVAGARSPSARAAVGELLADEVLHARVGWVFVAGQPQSVRDAIEADLLTLARPAFQCWWDESPFALPGGAPEHGIPTTQATRTAVLSAMREIVLPGFASLGFNVGPTEAWLAERPLC